MLHRKKFGAAPVAASLALVLGLGACQYSDIAAIQNDTEQPLTVHAEVDAPFARYDCDGSGGDRARFSSETTVDVAPGRRLCLEGPARGMDDTYDVRELLRLIEIRRGETLCLAVEGEAVLDALAPAGDVKALRVDEAVCPLGSLDTGEGTESAAAGTSGPE